jgi:thiamine-phosphate pyrophosphorylase
MTALDLSLYGLIDPEHCAGRNPVELALIAARNGVTLLQYRDKRNGVREMVEIARAMRDALDGTDIPLLVNDRVDVALAAGADGVHIGQEDMRAEDARRLLGLDAIIGLSIKTDEDAQTAPFDFIDYACIGGVHETGTKDNKRSIGVDGWKELAAMMRDRKPGMPVGAIAGFDVANTPEIIRAGADGVAYVSALFGKEDVAAACREMREIIDQARNGDGQ